MICGHIQYFTYINIICICGHIYKLYIYTFRQVQWFEHKYETARSDSTYAFYWRVMICANHPALSSLLVSFGPINCAAWNNVGRLPNVSSIHNGGSGQWMVGAAYCSISLARKDMAEDAEPFCHWRSSCSSAVREGAAVECERARLLCLLLRVVHVYFHHHHFITNFCTHDMIHMYTTCMYITHTWHMYSTTF